MKARGESLPMMPIGPILLTVLLVLIHFGLVDGVLRRMRISPRQARLTVSVMLLGSAFDVDLAPGLTINLGAGLVPLAAAVYLIATAGSAYERARTAAAALVTTCAVFLIGYWFPPGEPTELNLFFLDAQYLYGLTAAIVGYTAGRTRRSAFAAAVLGVILADLAHYVGLAVSGMPPGLAVHAGGGGFWATAMAAGVLAVLLGETIGEGLETLSRGDGAQWPRR